MVLSVPGLCPSRGRASPPLIPGSLSSPVVTSQYSIGPPSNFWNFQPFYQDVFGWKFQKFEGGPIEYWLVPTGDDKEAGINGGAAPAARGPEAGTRQSPPG